MSEMPVTFNSVIIALLGAGGATFLWTVVRSYLAIRNSAEVREDKAIANLEKWRDDADKRALDCLDRLANSREHIAYWQRRAAVMEHTALIAGLEIPPREPIPPQEGNY